jgi:tetratricopeptide (TPR) repeat protein
MIAVIRTGPPAAWLLTILLLLASALRGPDALLAQQEPWYQSYERGVQALNRGALQEAEQRLRAALAGNPTQGRRVRFYGMRFEAYIPEYYLAQVYARQGRYQEAAGLIARVQNARLLQTGDREYGELQKLGQSVQQQLAAASKAVTSVPGPETVMATGPNTASPSGGTAATGGTPATGGGNPPAGGGSSPGSGGGAENSGGPPPLVLERPPPAVVTTIATTTIPVDPKRVQFDRMMVLAETDYRTGRLGSARANATIARGLGFETPRVAAMLRNIEIAERLNAARQFVTGNPLGEAAAIKTAQGLVARVAELSPTSPELKGLQTRIQEGLGRLSVREKERGALRYYYTGDYAQARPLFEGLVSANPTSGRPLFYLACIEAALSVLDSSAQPDRLQKARDLFARAGRFGDNFAVDRKFVSPRLLEILEQTTVPGGTKQD